MNDDAQNANNPELEMYKCSLDIAALDELENRMHVLRSLIRDIEIERTRTLNVIRAQIINAYSL